ncbi:NUDIX hydrolase [Paenibacillus sp. FA6]|uniref:NUDIX hydrolase n=1 Tax=Paenibacillus sp. FA6 TaxID=3413029 RepID=UPI003F65A540
MSQIEQFDIFDYEMIKIGVETRENVHSRGLWHQTFHCWVINNSVSEGGSVLLQLRHKDKDTFPGLLDISCAGHLQSGETIEDGVRELEEELGISASLSELFYCGMVAQENVISNELIDREFNHVFIHENNKPLEEYNFQKDEISGLFFANIKDFKRLLSGDVDFFWVDGVVIDELDQQIHERRKIQGHDLTPN